MYNYNEIKPRLFTDEGQRSFIQIRDKTQELMKKSGAVRINEVMMGSCIETWTVLAAFDRMVEIGDIRELTTHGEVAGQHRVFVSTRL